MTCNNVRDLLETQTPPSSFTRSPELLREDRYGHDQQTWSWGFSNIPPQTPVSTCMADHTHPCCLVSSIIKPFLPHSAPVFRWQLRLLK